MRCLLMLYALELCGGALPEFANPPELSPDAQGRYALALKPSVVQINGSFYCLRLYNGQLPGPTIRIAASSAPRKVHVDFTNNLASPGSSMYREVSGKEGKEKPKCRDFAASNLHFHGGHVQPNFATFDAADRCNGKGCGANGQYYGDNVLLHLMPGESSRHRFDLDEDGTHEAGTNWYHPHVHGATAIQVVNGASGVFLVQGPIDNDPVISALPERVMLINEIPFSHKSAVPLASASAKCDATTYSINNFLSVTEGMPMLVNGVPKSILKTTSGTTERWRMVYAGTPDELALKFVQSTTGLCDSWSETPVLQFNQYARDGITMTEFYTSDTMWFSPGYRIDAFVTMPSSPGTYCLMGRRVHDLMGTTLLVVQVQPRKKGSAPKAPQASLLTTYAKPVEWSGKMNGKSTRISCTSTENVDPHQTVALLMPPFAQTSTKQLSEGKACTPSEDVKETQLNCYCPEPNIGCRNFDLRRAWNYRSDRVATLGTSEKWLIKAFDGHPFHIHINPYLVCPKTIPSNKEPNFPHWRDVMWVQVEDGPRHVLMEFRKFNGTYVTHCHKLNHEDEGMMELVEICAPGDSKCLCLDSASGTCTPNSGCFPDDENCKYAAAITQAYPAPASYASCGAKSLGLPAMPGAKTNGTASAKAAGGKTGAKAKGKATLTNPTASGDVPSNMAGKAGKAGKAASPTPSDAQAGPRAVPPPPLPPPGGPGPF